MRATVIMAVAFVVFSCKGKLKTMKGYDISKLPLQVVTDMFVVQTDKGQMQMRLEAPVMERYQSDTANWELFPGGFYLYGYDESGRLETEVKADMARHDNPKKGNELWSAIGHVSVKNLIKRETMETDTLYWDREKEIFYTHCYVRLYSPSGFMQGYGMECDQRARSSIIKLPFNSYGLVSRDSTLVEVDTVNFIGPFPKNN